MKRAALLVATMVLSSSALGVDRKPIGEVDTDRLTAETQAIAPAGDDHMNLVWWIPVEFWLATFADDPSMTDAQRKSIAKTLDGYTLLGVCQADVSAHGAFSFYGREEVGEAMTVVYEDAAGARHKLPQADRVGDDLRAILEVFQPVLGAAMGSMGENFHFFILSNRDESGARLIDPYGNGALRVGLAPRDGARLATTIDLPLDALYVPRQCPNGRDAHVSWEFCPWTGKRLPE